MTDYIKNRGNSNKKFIFTLITDIADGVNQPASAYVLPEEEAENTNILRLEGQSGAITLNCILTLSATDLADGTHTSTVKTIDEQISYLKDEIFTPDIDDYWVIRQARYYPTETNCVIESISFDERGGDPNAVRCTITLMLGSVL